MKIAFFFLYNMIMNVLGYINYCTFAAIQAEKEHEQFKTGIEGFDKDKLKDVQTIEKNTLPTKETIEQEKTA